MNWSSGKDAALAYYSLLQNDDFNVTHLLTTLSSEYDRVFMHGIREELLDMQAQLIGLPVIKLKLPASPGDDIYRLAMEQTYTELKKQGVTTAAFGDIFLEDLKIYREQQLGAVGVGACFPLWKRDTRQLVMDVEDADIEALIVCISEKHLGPEFLGRKIGRAFLNDLPANVDPCGENGEFHTFVYNAPFFRQPLHITRGEIVYKQYAPAAEGSDGWNTGFYFLDVMASR